MTLVDLTITVADATKGTNLLAKSGYHKSKHWRRIKALAIHGSAAADDCEFMLKYGSEDMGKIRNTKTGLVVVQADDMRTHSSLLSCPPDEDLSIEVVIAPGTNPIKLIADIQELKS